MKVFDTHKIKVISPDGYIDDDGNYITGVGQVLGMIHSAANCQGRHCVIHRPSDHSMRSFRTHWRSDRNIMERVCEHGVGHPDPDDYAFNLSIFLESADSTHGCDGCCAEINYDPDS